CEDRDYRADEPRQKDHSIPGGTDPIEYREFRLGAAIVWSACRFTAISQTQGSTFPDGQGNGEKAHDADDQGLNDSRADCLLWLGHYSSLLIVIRQCERLRNDYAIIATLMKGMASSLPLP